MLWRESRLAYVNLLSVHELIFDVLNSGNSYFVQVLVGYDDLEDITYCLHITLDEMIGGAGQELQFYILEYDGSAENNFNYFSAKDLALKIPSQDRVLIRACLLRGIEELIMVDLPERVFLCTFDADAPRKADRKFVLIADVFEAKGYEVKTADPYYGQRVWWMNRRSTPAG